MSDDPPEELPEHPPAKVKTTKAALTGKATLQASGTVAHHLHLVSDATGEVVNTVARASLVQFEALEPMEHYWTLIRNKVQMGKVLTKIGENPGPVIYTIVNEELRTVLLLGCRDIGVPCISAVEAVLEGLAFHWDIDLGDRFSDANIEIILDPQDRIQISEGTRGLLPRDPAANERFDSARQLSRSSLSSLKELLETCRSSDQTPREGDNRPAIPLASDLHTQLLAELSAGIALHDAPHPSATRLLPLRKLLKGLSEALKPFSEEALKKGGTVIGSGISAIIVTLIAKLTGALEHLEAFIKLLP